MIARFKTDFEKSLVVASFTLLVGSVYWVWQKQGETRRLRAQPVAAQLSGVAYESATVLAPDVAAVSWPEAPAQSQGGDWRYEVFTPPVIYYNTLARSFTATPPRFNHEDENRSFGLELLAVKLEPFRLQLVGYFGATGNYLAAFVSPQHPATLFGRTGQRFEQLGLTLKSFDVKKVIVAHDDAWPVYDVAGLAVLLDEKTGAEVVLDSRERKLTDTPLAVLKFAADDGAPRELREGDTFSDDTATYRIERIQLEPAEVVVARLAPGLPAPETKVLRATAPAAAAIGARAPGLKNSPLTHSATGLANNIP